MMGEERQQPAAIVIRGLGPDEWQGYKRLRLEALEREPQAFGATFASAVEKPDAYWCERLQVAPPEGWMRFALRDGVPVGMVAAYPGETGHIGIVSVYITAVERGRGVARALMESILRAIRDTADGPVMVRLHVNQDQAAAVGLYKTLGFTVVDESVEVLGDGNSHPQYHMEKKLV